VYYFEKGSFESRFPSGFAKIQKYFVISHQLTLHVGFLRKYLVFVNFF